MTMENEIKRKLMCSFVIKKRLKEFIKFLLANNITNKVFILKTEKPTVVLFTYNILKEVDLSNLKDYGCLNSISIQRNKDSNTLYSINALNMVLENIRMITEEDKKDIKINWKEYESCLLITADNKINKINTKILKILTLDEGFDLEKLNIV